MKTVSNIIQESVVLYKTHLKTYLPYSIMINIISIIISVGTAMITFFGFKMIGWKEISQANPVYFIILALIAIISVVFSTFIGAALIRVINKTLTKESLGSVAKELSEVRPIFWPILVTSIIVPLITIGGLLLFIIPGIIFSIWFSFALTSVVLDGKKPKEALTYSKSLVMGRWFQVLWYIIAPSFVFMIIGMVVSGIVNIPSSVAPDNVPVTIITTLLSLATTIILTPLYSIPFILAYHEFKNNPVATPVVPQN
jgi:hypothetical protein